MWYKFFLAGTLLVISFYNSSYAQLDYESSMKITTSKLLSHLKSCDSEGIVNLHDSSFAHTNKMNVRNYISGAAKENCIFLAKILKRHKMPGLENVIFKKDSERIRDANVVILPLINEPDTVLNLKNSFLVLVFYPDAYFNSSPNLLRYSIVKEEIKAEVQNYKIELPEWIRDANKKTLVIPDSSKRR